MNPTEVQRRFEEANRGLRNQRVDHLFADAKGDPSFNTREATQVQAANTLQEEQRVAAARRAQANGAHTVVGPDISVQEGQPVFTQDTPESEIPQPVQVQHPGYVGPHAPQRVQHVPVEGENIVGEASFMKPTLAGVQAVEVMPGVRAVRDVTQLERARASSVPAAQYAQPPVRVPPTGRAFPGTGSPYPQNQPARPMPQEAQIVTEPFPVEDNISFPPTDSVQQFEEDLHQAVPSNFSYVEQIPDLEDLVIKIAAHLGKEKAAEYFGTPQMVIGKWIEGKAKPKISDLQIVMADPQWRSEPIVRSGVEVLCKCGLETGDYAFTTEKPKFPVMIGCAVKGDISPAVVSSWIAMAKRYDVNFYLKAETLLVRARNEIVDMFLSTDNQYLLMVDADVILPFGNPDWYRTVTQWRQLKTTSFAMDTLPRLLSWRKEIVSGTYAGRAIGMSLITQCDMNPKSGGDKEQANRIRKGQTAGLVEQDWVPTGCMLIRRNVFDAIHKRFPNLAPRTAKGVFGYFNMDGDVGEDVSFCLRARQSGFRCYLDTELVLGHIGRMAFGLETSGGIRLQSM